jgi:hypothetical protein
MAWIGHGAVLRGVIMFLMRFEGGEGGGVHYMSVVVTSINNE